MDSTFALNPDLAADEEIVPCPESPPPPTATCVKNNKISKVEYHFAYLSANIIEPDPTRKPTN